MQEDVLSSPPEKVAEAFEYMRKTVLKGEHPKESDTSLLVLELKKYFVSSVTEKEKALGATISRMGEETFAERKAREEAEKQFRETAGREQNLRDENEELKTSVSDVSLTNAALAAQLKKTQHRQRLFAAITTFVIGIIIAIYQDLLIEIVLTKYPQLLPNFVKWIIPLLGLLTLVCPSVYYIRKTKQSSEVRIILSAILLVLGLSLFKFFSDESISLLASVVEVAVLIATIAVLFRFSDEP